MLSETHAARPGRRGAAHALAACLALLLAVFVPAQQPSEYDVKAVYLLNFLKFVQWPDSAFASPDSPITICILGRDPFGSTIDSVVQDEQVEGRKVVVRRISEPPASHKACQLIFAAGNPRETAPLLASLRPGELTVGEGETFVREGGMIAFILENRRVRFDINRSAAEEAGLVLSSKLLSVARAVKK